MELAKYIDHTFLGASGCHDAVERLCREAAEHGFCTVCVNPAEVARAKNFLDGSSVKVCSVIGFPLGQNTFAVKKFEALDAIANGADELDFVINIRLLRFDPEACEKELEGLSLSSRAAKPSVVLKLIIECCYLTDDEKVLACRMAQRAGFDFVKTSTGFGPGGATAEDVKLMRETVGPVMGVKAAGGIRTREDAEKMIASGASRLGCSASLEIIPRV